MHRACMCILSDNQHILRAEGEQAVHAPDAQCYTNLGNDIVLTGKF